MNCQWHTSSLTMPRCVRTAKSPIASFPLRIQHFKSHDIGKVECQPHSHGLVVIKPAVRNIWWLRLNGEPCVTPTRPLFGQLTTAHHQRSATRALRRRQLSFWPIISAITNSIMSYLNRYSFLTFFEINLPIWHLAKIVPLRFCKVLLLV